MHHCEVNVLIALEVKLSGKRRVDEFGKSEVAGEHRM